nr:unnamed protein product [Spirometra erinaceieuropaei]
MVSIPPTEQPRNQRQNPDFLPITHLLTSSITSGISSFNPTNADTVYGLGIDVQLNISTTGFLQPPTLPITIPLINSGRSATTLKPGTAPLLSADGSTPLTEKTQILQRWAEHFRGVLNCPSTISDAAIACLPQVVTNLELDLPPSLSETIRAMQQHSSGKAPATDAIPAEVYKHGGPQLMDHLTALFQEMWRQGESCRISKTSQSCIYTSEMETANSSTITEASS